MGFFFFFFKWSLQLIQGLDALGIATLDSITSTATASFPFISFFSFSSMTDEDKVNLRTLHRLMLLVSGHQSTENTDKVRTFASSTLQCSYIIIKRERERERIKTRFISNMYKFHWTKSCIVLLLVLEIVQYRHAHAHIHWCSSQYMVGQSLLCTRATNYTRK